MNFDGPISGNNVLAGLHISGGTANLNFGNPSANFEATTALPTKHKPTYYLPFSRNRRFIGRKNELDELQQKLVIRQECQKIAVVGLGGIGKTQIVLEFAQWVKREKPEYLIFWVSAVSLESFEQSCTEIARILRIPRPADDKTDVKELVRWYLSDSAAGKWLLVVDNADDMQVLYTDGSSNGVVDFLPESDDGLTLFTSRRKEVGHSLVNGDIIEVGEMSEEEAVKFLSASLQEDSLDDSATRQLVAELEYLPLAIAQAAAYIKINKIIISKYLDLIRSTDADLIAVMSREFKDSTRKQAANAVATTWVISFKQILAEDTDAADLLAFMSCIEWKGIPHSILPPVQPEARMRDAIGMIRSYSFLSKREDGEIYDMHRLVHLAMRIWLQHNEPANLAQIKAVKHITNVFPSDDYENRTLWREYLPHASRVSTSAHVDSAKKVSMLDLKLGQCLQVDGRIQEAATWLKKSCQWRERHLKETHPDRLTSQHALAGAYRANGQVQEAVELLKQVVKIKATTLAETHPSRLASQHALASAYQANGQVQEAAELLKQVVKIKKIT